VAEATKDAEGQEPSGAEPGGGRRDRTPEQRAERRAKRIDRYVVPGLAVVLALAVGALVIVFSDTELLGSWGGFFRHPGATLSASWNKVYEAYRALLEGALGNPSEMGQAISSGDLDQIQAAFRPLSEVIVTTTPLIFAGLAVALGFKAGLFNIGAEGQITVGALVAGYVGFTVHVPGPLLVLLVILGGFVGGALWGSVPGLLKAKTGAHEVITTIMMNFIAFRLLDYALSNDVFQRPDRNDPISRPINAAFPHLVGSQLRVHWGFVLAIVIAVAVSFLLRRTTIGFEFRAVGANPDASRAAGMSPSRIYVTVMALCGGLAGLVGANQLLSTGPSLTPGFSSNYGFDAIAIALLGRSNPSGVVAAAFLFGILRGGSRVMTAATQIPADIVVVIQALVIVFVAAPALVRAIFRFKARPASLAPVTKGWGG
jgi:general nucleoside transport system permease protein